MNLRRLPVIPTVIVVLAVAVMLRLGFWQLERLRWKEDLLARYTAAVASPGEVAWPQGAAATDAALYHRSRIDCLSVAGATTTSGRSAGGQSGVAHVVQCALAGGGSAKVVLGWSRDPAAVAWPGGVVTGVIAPGPRLVADPPLAGLAANARPDPGEIVNNHFGYAVQWFLFAATALIIYAIAVRKHLKP